MGQHFGIVCHMRGKLHVPMVQSFKIIICIGYHMSGEVISVLSLEGRYYNCHERAQRARDNYDIVTRVYYILVPLSGRN